MVRHSIAILLTGMILATPAWGLMPGYIQSLGVYGDKSLGETDFFCHKVFNHIPTPQITTELLLFCERSPIFEELGAEKKSNITPNSLTLQYSFFVPFEPQWINTVDLLQGLYKAGESREGKHRALRNLGKKPSPLASDHWFIDTQRFPLPNSEPYRTQLWAVQVAPYNRHAYALIEVLIKRTSTLSDLKRLVGILPTTRGGVVLHQMVLKFEPGSLDLRTIVILERSFEDQNKNLRDRIFEELDPQFKVTQQNL